MKKENTGAYGFSGCWSAQIVVNNIVYALNTYDSKIVAEEEVRYACQLRQAGWSGLKIQAKINSYTNNN